MVGQADMMQARWGSHGDYALISMSPQSPQESFDLIIDAFNLAEVYRVPVMFMMDECVGHMTEKVVIPEPDEIEIMPRKLTKLKPEEYLPYKVPKGEWVPEFARAGDGYRYHTTGLTHDERGYPVMSADCQQVCVSRLREKIIQNTDKIVRYDEEEIDGAEVIVIAYGITARVTRMGIDLARKQGVKVGFIRLIVVWPFPEQLIRTLASKVKAFVVPEINYGQIVLEVERCAAGKAKAVSVPHAGGGVHDPNVICKAIVGAAK
jgi:2-oxoglutarate ferredoxin oxidoreductase subunit alpha